MSSGISWLHLSDLHCGSKGFDKKWGTVRAAMRADLKAQLARLNAQLDLVLFTGDLTQSARPEQFTQLEEFLEELWELFRACGCNPKLFAIPGNHDLVRPTVNQQKTISFSNLKNHWREEPVQNEFWDIKTGASSRQIVSRAFANYQKWWEKVPADRRLDCSSGILSGDCAATFVKDGIKLGLLGLNSAYLQLDDSISEDDGALDVRLAQADAACGKGGLSKWVESHQVCFLMTHHPATWLFDGGREFVQDVCDGPANFALHLFGHMHEQKVAEISVQGGKPRTTVQALSLLSVEPWYHGTTRRDRLAAGYSFGRLVKRGTRFAYSLIPRRLSRVGDVNQMIKDFSFEFENSAQEQTRWKLTWTRDRSDNIGASRIPAAFVDRFREIGALKGPLKYSDAHDFLKEWLSQNNHVLDHVSVKNIAFDLQHTFIFIETLVGLPWPKGLTWKTIFIDHQAPEIQTRIEKDPDLKIMAAKVNEARLVKLIVEDLPRLTKDISLEARTYNELPTMHGFLIDNSVLVAAVCDTFAGKIKTTPYMVFVWDKEDQNPGPDIAKDMIEIFSSWFEAHWSSGRPIIGDIGSADHVKAVSA